jgi:predicted O-methyltransferase YrrM
MFQTSGISEDWLQSVSTPVSALLRELEEETNAAFPKGRHMQSGFSQGRLLALISSLLRPDRILEIGTFTGYGSLCLAEGLAENGMLITLENSAEHASFARRFFEKSAFASSIRLMEGNAADILPALTEHWDLVYLDADKSSNRFYLEKIWPQLKPGGIILTDNVFARGGIFKPEDEQRNFEKAVTMLNREMPAMFPEADVFILPIRDGLSVLRKKT